MTLPAKVTLIPKAFSAIAAALNGLLTWAEPWEKMKVGMGLKFTRAPGGHLLSVDVSQMAQVMAGNGGLGMRQVPFSITAAGDVPTSAEIETGIEAGYSALSLTPRPMDFLYSTPFNYLVGGEKDAGGTNVGENGVFRIKFDVNGVSYIAHNIGPNRLYS